MRTQFFFLICFIVSVETFGQKVYNLTSALAEPNPELVFIIKSDAYYEGDYTVIPDAICKFTNLELLEIAQPKLTKLPDAVGCLKNLKTLTLQRCDMLTTLPKSFENLNLEILSIQNCRNLNDFSAISGIKTLRTLQMNSFAFTPLSVQNADFISELSNLEFLELDIPQSNPNVLERLSKIQVITLGNYLPPSVCNLKNLERIFMKANEVFDVPACLPKCIKLQFLDLGNAPFNPKQVKKLRKQFPEFQIKHKGLDD
jgi:Leucine-rich repeat (LRR) protein